MDQKQKQEIMQKFNVPVAKKKSFYYAALSGALLPLTVISFGTGELLLGACQAVGLGVGVLYTWANAKKEHMETMMDGYTLAVLETMIENIDRAIESLEKEESEDA